MIVYENTKKGFINDVDRGILADKLKLLFKTHHIGSGDREYESWKNSSVFMKKIISDDRFDDGISIYLEYQVFLTSKRVDFLVAGTDADGNNNIVIVELKQWEMCERTGKHDVVVAYTGGMRQEVPHPSYQAQSYVDMLTAYAKSIVDNNIGVYSCAYLHNYDNRKINELRCEMFKTLLEASPTFIKGEEEKLIGYISQYVCHKQTVDVFSLIETSELIPGKQLQDAITDMMQGTSMFNLIDEQKVVFEQVLYSVQNSLASDKKTVIICQGGPGTGKSVVALKLLCDLILDKKSARYVTHNSSLKNVYKNVLNKAGHKLKALDAIFAGDGMFQSKNIAENAYDCVLVDEAHRITEHWSHSHDEQHIDTIVRAGKVSVFFIDEKQIVTVNDFGTVSRICESAAKYGADVIQGVDYDLISQFRCGGSDGFIGFIDKVLYGIDNPFTISPNYEVKVFKDPIKFREALRERNSNNRARMVAGYCYEWVTGKEKAKKKVAKELGIPQEQWKTHPRFQYDIKLGNFTAKWNLSYDKTWITSPDSFEQVGCIHTSQGLELDYCGVIIGKDLRFENGMIITDQTKVADSDDTSGIRTCKDKNLAKKLILNTYRTMLTRGQKGCYIFCEDEALGKYFLNELGADYADDEIPLTPSQKEGLEKLLSGENCFVTGEGGTGKSYLIEKFADIVRGQKKILKCAPTGIAAEHIHGRTIHRCFQPQAVPSVIEKDSIAKDGVIQYISKYDVIIIDEISMCRIDLFEYVMRTIDEALKLKGSNIQIILCGDFFQLPPVVPEYEAPILKALYQTEEGFAFESNEWKKHHLVMVDLKENVRQGQIESEEAYDFMKYLNNLRAHRDVAETLNYFNFKCKKDKNCDGNTIELHTTNEKVDLYNREGLNSLPGDIYSYHAVIGGDIPKEKYPIKETVDLKVGAKVMFLRNDTRNYEYQNGTLGVVKECFPDCVIVTVGRKDVCLTPYEYTVSSEPTLNEKTGEIEQEVFDGTYTQLPLCLAYAITVHKSQGQTFNSVNFDPCGNGAEHLQNGQLYVALSRLATIEGLYCYHKIKESEWKTSQKVIDFYRNN
ncbi:MAG: DUF2075 domain-containing protein [Eubacteriales bacterium]|nr:DUF2075 domain-containing protein [Eubacteriales bacterium]